MTRFPGGRAAVAALIAPLLISMGTASPASAMQILDAVDHGELAAAIAAGEVSRIALSHDRVKKVIRAPDGLRVEHDAASGDLYLTPAGVADDGEAASLFIVTEKGFTYRLTLTPVWDGAAQILIRNPAASALDGDAAGPDPWIAELVALVRAVARREPMAGYAIEGGGAQSAGAVKLIETWRGPRFAAHVVEAGNDPSTGTGPATGTDARDVAALAGTMFGGEGRARVAAVWLAPRLTGPSGGRLAVLVTEAVSAAAAAGEPR